MTSQQLVNSIVNLGLYRSLLRSYENMLSDYQLEHAEKLEEARLNFDNAIKDIIENSYQYSCSSGHTQIGWSGNEACPLCKQRGIVATLEKTLERRQYDLDRICRWLSRQPCLRALVEAKDKNGRYDESEWT
jgi:hypothetical protein